jgi:Ser/Thr protein kinase RdoA (MazF antagonist)
MTDSSANSSANLAADGLARAANVFFPNATGMNPVANREHLLRIETESGSWCLRRWPNGTPRERVAFVHHLLQTARDAGVEFVPAVASAPSGETILLLDGDLYDAQSWLPGKAPSRGLAVTDNRGRLINRPLQLSKTALSAAVRAVATLHLATESLAEESDVPRASLEAVLRAVRASWDEQRLRLRPYAPRTPQIQRWIRSSEPVIDSAIESITAANYLQLRPRVVAHLNLWPSHLLLSRIDGQDRVTGIVDFADAAASSPLLDIAQMLTHFNGWTGAAAEEVIGAYTDVRPLAPEERRLLPAIAGLDLLVETGRLLVLGHATQSIVESGGGDSVRASAASMLLSLEGIAPAVQRGDRKEPSRARKWDYGPPRANPKRSPRTRTNRERP